jgi:hypothetical protein
METRKSLHYQFSRADLHPESEILMLKLNWSWRHSKHIAHVDNAEETFVEVEVILRPPVSRPVRLGVRHPSGTRDQFFFLFEIFIRQLRFCYFLAPSLTRERVCNLLTKICRNLRTHNKTSTDICCVRRFLHILVDTRATGYITQWLRL